LLQANCETDVNHHSSNLQLLSVTAYITKPKSGYIISEKDVES